MTLRWARVGSLIYAPKRGSIVRERGSTFPIATLYPLEIWFYRVNFFDYKWSLLLLGSLSLTHSHLNVCYWLLLGGLT